MAKNITDTNKPTPLVVGKTQTTGCTNTTLCMVMRTSAMATWKSEQVSDQRGGTVACLVYAVGKNKFILYILL